MRAFINDRDKVAYCITEEVATACRVGLWFGRDYPDLRAWVVRCLDSELKLHPLSHYREADADGPLSLARIIRRGPECPHVCPRHPRVD